MTTIYSDSNNSNSNKNNNNNNNDNNNKNCNVLQQKFVRNMKGLLKGIHFLLLEFLLMIQKSENFTIYSNKEVEEREVVEEVLKFLKTKLKITRKSDVERSFQCSDLYIATNFIPSGNLLGKDERWG
ncbi:hypothetical protein V1477_017219 [Vespula maculifrons]|uniref:Uncharacterized protein n=1 Tax=Vespula maculifrons TaxID=7453 RepID=A0ABD2B5F9_VESMC